MENFGVAYNAELKFSLNETYEEKFLIIVDNKIQNFEDEFKVKSTDTVLSLL